MISIFGGIRPLRALFFVATVFGGAASLPAMDDEGRPSFTIHVVVAERGGRVDWSHSGINRIACDIKGNDGYYDLVTMDPDGSNPVNLTTGASIPQKHIGNPAWHPAGGFIVFQVQDPSLPFSSPEAEAYQASPGAGVHNNLWLARADGSRFWQLTRVGYRGGVLHPHFSHDGTMIVFVERLSDGGSAYGTWVIKVAELAFLSSGPVLVNERTLDPCEGKPWYEAHGFTPNDKGIIFTGVPKAGQPATGMDICTLDRKGRELGRLTLSYFGWDEHAHFSPKGRKIAWISSRDIPQLILPFQVKTDVWVMNANGSHKRRVTFFNEPGSPHYIPDGAIPGDLCWGPDGRSLMVRVHELKYNMEWLVRLDLD